MIALGGVRHLDLAGENGRLPAALVQSEVVPLRRAYDMVLDRRVAEGKVRPFSEKRRDPAGDFRDEGSFIDGHERLPIDLGIGV